MILAAGGGSTIDCAKGIAAAAMTEDGDIWPLVKNGVWVMKALPIVAILTNAATGLEMDAWAVMPTVVKWTPIAMKEPENYEARANLMWASSMALNTILDGGTVHNCACHAMEHELSAYYDITHGHGLAILTPRWLTYILSDDTAPAISRFGQKVFDIPSNSDPMTGAKKAIDALTDFCFHTLGLAPTLTDLNIDRTHFEAMANHACGGDAIHDPKALTPDDVVRIYEACL